MTPGSQRQDTRTDDWAAVRRRLDDAREGLRDSVRVTPEQARALLEERARALAKPTERKRPETTRDMVLFTIAGQRYALETRYVVEVFRPVDLALLPGAEPTVRGVVGWRGRLLTITDLRAMLGRPATTLSDLGRVIVMGDERPEFGILADSVEEIVTLSDDAVRVPERGIKVNERYVRGIAPDGALVLDATELLRVDDDANMGELER